MHQAFKAIRVMLTYARTATIINILAVCIMALMTPLSLFLTQRLIDYIPLYINGEVSFTIMSVFVGGLLLSMILAANIHLLNETQKIQIRRQLDENFTPIVIDKYKKLDYVCFEDSDIQDTLSRMGNNPQEKIVELFFNLTSLLSSFVSIIGLILIFSQVSIWFSVSFFVILIYMMWCEFKAMDMMNRMFNGQTQAERRLSYFSSLLSDKKSLFELRLFSAIDYIKKKWHTVADEVLNERIVTTIKSQKYFAISSICIVAWIALVIFSLIFAIQNEAITIGLFISLIGSTGSILDMTGSISYNFSKLSQNSLQMKHYDAFMALPEIQINQGKNYSKIKNPIIRFENVFFKYPNADDYILKGVTFTIYPNERIALVGENGAGKSTIIKLLCRLYQPDKGKITVNDLDIQHLSRTQIRQVCSVVFQDFSNYELTLRENVGLGNIQKLDDDSAILRALEQGMAEQIGDNLDINLGKIEEDGVDLSGGQWQRIALARACIADSSFVILDEPTAALDPIAESQMYTSFNKLMEDRGCIMISHRLASAKICDRILVLESGRVVEEGPHRELMESQGLYAKMFEKQSEWYREGGDKHEA